MVSSDSNDQMSPHHKQDLIEISSDGMYTDINQTHRHNSVLGTSTKHLKVRGEADRRYQRNAECIEMKYKAKNKKVLSFKAGDFVSNRIPRIARASTDIHRLPCIIV